MVPYPYCRYPALFFHYRYPIADLTITTRISKFTINTRRSISLSLPSDHFYYPTVYPTGAIQVSNLTIASLRST